MTAGQAWLLDEDPDSRAVVSDVLEKAGLAVAAFESPSDLLAQAGAPPAIAVIDAWTARWHPGQIRAALLSTPIVLMTTEPEQEEEWLKLGVTWTLRKPFSIDALRAAVRSATA
jgi:DNA-binding response OmpR family regulator